MEKLVTPESQFQNLPSYPFAANYCALSDGLNMHYVDEGPRDGQIVLLLHGEPSWSFLYRKMIPVFTAAGYRAIAPDLIGFGKSDKLLTTAAYTYEKHLAWVRQFIVQLDLTNVALFAQDWGGLLGLRLAVELKERFSSIIASNTALPTGSGQMPESFFQWQTYSQTVPELPVGKIIDRGTATELSPEVVAAYDAPYPEEKYKAAARIFPALVPTSEEDPESANNKAAWAQLAQWEKPFLTLFGDSDPIMRGAEKYFIDRVPGAKGQAHKIIAQAGHFIQEDQGEEVAGLCVEFLNSQKQ